MTPEIPCATCTRFKSEVRDRTVCDAYPEGIPQAIMYHWAADGHREPYKGDHGLRYDPIPEIAAILAKQAAEGEGEDDV